MSNKQTSTLNDQQPQQQLIDQSPVGIFYTDGYGDCSYVNRRWCEITGLTSAQANHEYWLKALHPDDRNHCHQEWDYAFHHKQNYQSEHRYVRKDGTIIWVLAQAYPENYDFGQGRRFIGTLIDITPQKITEINLRNSANKLKHQHQKDVNK